MQGSAPACNMQVATVTMKACIPVTAGFVGGEDKCRITHLGAHAGKASALNAQGARPGGMAVPAHVDAALALAAHQDVV